MNKRKLSKMKDTATWRSDIKDFSLITKDMADLMVKECELALSGSIDSCESVINRADKIIALYIPICTALTIYVLPKIKDFKTLHTLLMADKLFFSAFICFVISIMGLIICLFNTKSYVIRGVGSDPKKLVSSTYIDNEFEKDLKYIFACVAICENAEARIKKNENKAYWKSVLNNIAVYMLFAFPICPILVYLYYLI